MVVVGCVDVVVGAFVVDVVVGSVVGGVIGVCVEFSGLSSKTPIFTVVVEPDDDMVDSLVDLGVELEEVEFDEAGVVDDVLEEEDELEDDVFVEAELVEFDDEVGEVEDDAAAGEAEDGVVDVEAVEEFPLESPEFDDAADEELEDAPDDSPFDDALVALVELVLGRIDWPGSYSIWRSWPSS